MSGWLLLAGVLAALLAVYLVLTGWRATRGRRIRALGGGGGRGGPAGRGTGAGRPLVTRRFDAARPVTDAEYAAEAGTGVGTRIGPTGPGTQAGGQAGPWGRVAVPGWEHPLPWSYEESRLVLLVRDPWWLFAYWEITGEAHTLAEASVGKEAWARARSVLRVYDTPTGTHYDVGIDEKARNWYLNVGQPDRTWYAELGRVTESGRFLMLVRSNTVHTPRDGPSPVIDSRWPPLGWEGYSLEAMPASPGMRAGASPGMRGSLIDQGGSKL